MTYEEIEILGKMVNINISEEESRDLIPKMESVLGYIDQIRAVEIKDQELNTVGQNPKLRDDSQENPTNFTETFMQGVPESSDGYVKVHRILGGE